MPRRFDTRITTENFGDSFKRILRNATEQLGFTAKPPLRLLTLGGGPILTLDREAELLIGKTDEEIEARSGTTPGSGEVSIYTLDTSGVLTDTTTNYTAYHLGGEAIATGTWVMLSYHRHSGTWWVTFEDCTGS